MSNEIFILQVQSSPLSGQHPKQPCMGDSPSSLTCGLLESYSQSWSPKEECHTQVRSGSLEMGLWWIPFWQPLRTPHPVAIVSPAFCWAGVGRTQTGLAREKQTRSYCGLCARINVISIQDECLSPPSSWNLSTLSRSMCHGSQSRNVTGRASVQIEFADMSGKEKEKSPHFSPWVSATVIIL
jgi:hypothetical protein